MTSLKRWKKGLNINTMEKIAVKLRIKPLVRRSPTQRLKSRLYYRKNKSKLRVQRRRYMRTHGSTLKHRKMFMRFKPTWFKKIKHLSPLKTKKPKKFTLIVPKFKKTKKLVKIPH